MSTIVRFFVAENEGAIAALSVGPDSSFRTLSFGNFDAEEALLDWEAHLTGVTFESLVDSDLPVVIAEEDEGPSVFLLSDKLVDSLTVASDSEVRDLVNWWVGEKSVAGVKIELSVASDILRGLVNFLREEREPGMCVYCWVS